MISEEFIRILKTIPQPCLTCGGTGQVFNECHYPPWQVCSNCNGDGVALWQECRA